MTSKVIQKILLMENDLTRDKHAHKIKPKKMKGLRKFGREKIQSGIFSWGKKHRQEIKEMIIKEGNIKEED